MAYTCAPINLTLAGTYTIVAGVTGKVTRVYAANIQANLLTSFSFKSGATTLTGPMTHVVGGTFSLPLSETTPYFECGVGEDLIINIGGLTGNIGGFILYVQTDA